MKYLFDYTRNSALIGFAEHEIFHKTQSHTAEEEGIIGRETGRHEMLLLAARGTTISIVRHDRLIEVLCFYNCCHVYFLNIQKYVL